MYEVCKSKLVYICVCTMFAVAVCMSILSGGSVPGFGTGLLPGAALPQVSQSPLPPPDPDGPWMALAQSPLPPPDPDGPWMALAQSPLPPPDPDGPWMALA